MSKRPLFILGDKPKANETMIHEGQAARDWAAQADTQISVTNGGVQGRSDFAATPTVLKSADIL